MFKFYRVLSLGYKVHIIWGFCTTLMEVHFYLYGKYLSLIIWWVDSEHNSDHLVYIKELKYLELMLKDVYSFLFYFLDFFY